MKQKAISLLALAAITISSVTTAFGANASYSKLNNQVITKDSPNLNVNAPIFSNVNGASTLNKNIENLLIEKIGYINNIGDHNGISSASLDSYYELNQGGAFYSFQLFIEEYSGGGSSLTNLYAYTIDSDANKLYSFRDLFDNPDDAIDEVTDIIIDKIKDGGRIYLDDAEDTVEDYNGNFSYFFEGTDLIVYFNPGAIASENRGIQYFAFPLENLDQYMKERVLKNIQYMSESSTVQRNGQSFSLSNPVYESETTLMVPLRELGEAMGLSITWDEKYGALADGQIVSNKTKPQIIQEVTYVPADYLVNLGNAYYTINHDGEAIFRIFANTTSTQIYSGIADFISPSSAQDCAEFYAQSKLDKTDVITYALLSDTLRDKMGVRNSTSNPSYTDYKIYKIGDDTFRIVFTYGVHSLTESGQKTEMLKINQIENSKYYEITNITNV